MALEPSTPSYKHRKELVLSGKSEDLEEYLKDLLDQLRKRDEDIRRAIQEHSDRLGTTNYPHSLETE